MKSLLIFISLLFLTLSSGAQNTAVVAADKMNVLYAGIDNPISVAVPGVPDDQVSVSVTGATITKKEPGKYVISNLQNPASFPEVIVNVMVAGKMIGSSIFRVKRFSDPLATLNDGSKSNHKYYITKDDLLKAGQLNVLFDSPFDDLNFTIVSYTISISEMGFLKEFECTGNKFSEAAIKQISMAVPGQVYYFENIKVKGPDGSVRVLGSIKEVIVE